MEGLLDYSERLTRAAIREMPDGEFSFQDYLEGDGFSDEPLPIQATVSVERRRDGGGFHRHGLADGGVRERPLRHCPLRRPIRGAVHRRRAGARQPGRPADRSRCRRRWGRWSIPLLLTP